MSVNLEAQDVLNAVIGQRDHFANTAAQLQAQVTALSRELNLARAELGIAKTKLARMEEPAKEEPEDPTQQELKTQPEPPKLSEVPKVPVFGQIPRPVPMDRPRAKKLPDIPPV